MLPLNSNFITRNIYIEVRHVLLMEFEIVKLSSKGQLVIPADIREGFNEGDKLIVIRDADKIIIEKITVLTEKLKEDIEFARKTEEAYKRHEKGEFKTLEESEFLEEIKRW